MEEMIHDTQIQGWTVVNVDFKCWKLVLSFFLEFVSATSSIENLPKKNLNFC